MSKCQLYRSVSDDPYFNLALERYLFERSPADSTVLFFYVNRPCVVVGRNQNPWVEVNLPRLRDNPLGQRVDLVRRRSGGGAVFHDHGNVNFSVICPPATFTRDRAIDMVLSALHHPEPRAAKNERHDMILRFEDGPRKVSGSAYKLSRTRAMHHATCLIDSPNLDLISSFLRSPAAAYVKAKGVESVRSPVSNLYPGRGQHGIGDFIARVSAAFSKSLGLGSDGMELLTGGARQPFFRTHSSAVYGLLGHDLLDIELIRSALQELLSPAWVFGATPAFTFSSSASPDDREGSGPSSSEQCRLTFNARGGAIIEATLQGPGLERRKTSDATGLRGLKLYEIASWKPLLARLHAHDESSSCSTADLDQLSNWLKDTAGFAAPKP